MFLLGLVGFGMLGWDVSHPYKSVYDQNTRDFARQLWSERAQQGEMACAKTDFAVRFDPRGWRSDRTALYLCHQAIYSPRHRDKAPYNPQCVRSDHPLICVVYNERPNDRPGVAEWLSTMSERFELTDRREHVVNKGVKNRAGNYQDRYVLYEFVPKGTLSQRPASRLR
jgi:hypothetical protein